MAGARGLLGLSWSPWSPQGPSWSRRRIPGRARPHAALIKTDQDQAQPTGTCSNRLENTNWY
eukprot:6943354-Pyramimonas_sp.AAC.1